MSFLVTRGLGLGANNFIASGGLGIGVVNTHTFDLATHWTDGTVILNLVNWFGIPSTDSTPGLDETYANWQSLSSPAWVVADIANYPAKPYLSRDASLCRAYGGGQYRDISARYRPLIGIYSSSGREAESLAVIDLTLQAVRSGADPRARVDVISTFVKYLGGTSYAGLDNGDVGYISGEDVQYRAYRALLARAEAAGMTNCISFQYGNSAQWEAWHPEFTTRAQRLSSVSQDLADYATIAQASTAAWKINGLVVVDIWPGAAPAMTDAEWAHAIAEARTLSGLDMYVLAYRKTGASFAWADALHPWISYTEWASTTGATDEAHAAAWKIASEADLVLELPNYAGRVMLTCISGGFDDWSKHNGAGTERRIPRTEPIIKGQFTGGSASATGYYIATWDDIGEGQHFQPSVNEDGAMLRYLTEQLGAALSEVVDGDETQALLNRWINYPKLRPCATVARGSGRAHHFAARTHHATSAPNRGTHGGGSRSFYIRSNA
jgi:hypothetical protein